MHCFITPMRVCPFDYLIWRIPPEIDLRRLSGLSEYLLLLTVWRTSTNRVWSRHLPTLPFTLGFLFPVSWWRQRGSQNSTWNLIVTFRHWYRVLQRFIFYVVSSKKITSTQLAIFHVYVIYLIVGVFSWWVQSSYWKPKHWGNRYQVPTTEVN